MSSRSALVATDLDRTMIYSAQACADLAAVDTVCVEYLAGQPLSYMTVAAAAKLRELANQVMVVPTTTRTVTQFQRIALPGGPWEYAITSNGGNLLVDGVPDPSWRAGIAQRMRAETAALAEVSAQLRARIDESWVRTFRVADELFCYLVVDPPSIPAGFMAEWDRWCRPRGWSVSRQGRKIYTMPLVVTKSAAVVEVRRRLHTAGRLASGAQILAAGDGALDADLLAAADAAIRPRHGELEELSWTHPRLRVTQSSGITAAEHILDWFANTAMHRGATSATPFLVE